MQESACARTRRQGGMRPTLTPESRVLRALAHPERLAIVEWLRHRSGCVCPFEASAPRRVRVPSVQRGRADGKSHAMIADLLLAGLGAVQDYVALHVLTCLIPAFLLAGAMVTFISKEAIMQRLGAAASKPATFSTAAGASFFLAACSCTVIPVSSGLHYRGAGSRAAFILLWVAPASHPP